MEKYENNTPHHEEIIIYNDSSLQDLRIQRVLIQIYRLLQQEDEQYYLLMKAIVVRCWKLMRSYPISISAYNYSLIIPESLMYPRRCRKIHRITRR